MATGADRIDREALAADAWRAAQLLAIDPVGIGGVLLRGSAGGLREHWLASLRSLMPSSAPWLRMPLHIDDERLLGGLDLTATLQAGRPVAQAGLLSRCDGGLLLVAMAERLTAMAAARLCHVMDAHAVTLQRDGFASVTPARLGVVALDEGGEGDDPVTPALRERLALQLDMDALQRLRVLPPAADSDASDVAGTEAARARLPDVGVEDGMLRTLCEAALALGVPSLRASVQVLAVARAAAALAGHDEVQADDAALAIRLVLLPRATRLPSGEDAESEPAPPEDAEAPPEPPPQDANGSDDTTATPPPPPVPEEGLPEQVLQAAMASLPPDLLALMVSQGAAQRRAAAGRAGARQASRLRGRPFGSRRGEPRGGARIHLIDTLRAAAPWQAVRARERAAASGTAAVGKVDVRKQDLHITRFRQRSETTTIFVVDASGSAALHRLAEAKGAVELLLADCYVRRDRVAMLAFRGKGAELLLPPTRSLVRAKRSLAGMPGGGGTPLATGLDGARELALACVRRGETPILVLLTDGRANIARDGSPGRERAGADALAAARTVRAAGLTALLVDTSPQPQPVAERLAAEMGAAYLPLPHAGAGTVNQAIRLASARPAR
jgi:magnesium chelatase subunit D